MTDVLVMGAGAVGGYYGACLVRAGHAVTFVARGANLDALRSKGLRVTGAMGEITVDDVRATDDPSSVSADLVLMGVKNYDLPDAARAVRDSGGIVLTLQNGVDAPDVARDVLGDVVLAGTTGIVADMPEPGHVDVVSAYAWVRFGEWAAGGTGVWTGADGSGITERVEHVHAWIGVDGIDAIAVPDARVALWEKMTLMCGMAGLTTLYQRPMGKILGDASTREEFVAIFRECERVARAKDVQLPDDFIEQRIAYAENVDKAAMSSMSRDFARGRKIEIETFNGAIVRMGAELGIDVPANRAVYDGIVAAARR
jgi:2-dehydropantoate 2-reductase